MDFAEGVGAWGLWKGRTVTRGAEAVGMFCTVYRCEGIGVGAGLKAVKTLHLAGRQGTRPLHRKSILICSDSQSVIRALEKGPLSQDNDVTSGIWATLLELLDDKIGVSRVVFQWVPGHSFLPKNVSIDNFAKSQQERLKRYQDEVPISFEGIKSWATYQAHQRWISSPGSDSRVRLIGPWKTSQSLSAGLSRANETLLSQIRTGQCRLAGPLWRHLNNGQVSCRWCGLSDETIPHLLLDCTHVGICARRRSVRVLRTRSNKPIMEKPSLDDLKQLAAFLRGIVELL